MSDPILEVSQLSLSFGGTKAIRDVSFDVQRHELFAVIGPNGAGKTSIFNCISGVYEPQVGSILLDGEGLLGERPENIARKGVARMFQNIELFDNLTVLDNLMLGRTTHMLYSVLAAFAFTPGVRKAERENRAVVEELIDFLDIESYRAYPVGMLPYGVKKRVEMGRALAMEPSLLLLDEPVAGMNVEEKQDMCRFVLDVNDEFGTTVVLIEHDMGVVMDISDRVVVLDYGKKIGDGTPDEVRNNEDVIRAYLGTSH